MSSVNSFDNEAGASAVYSVVVSDALKFNGGDNLTIGMQNIADNCNHREITATSSTSTGISFLFDVNREHAISSDFAINIEKFSFRVNAPKSSVWTEEEYLTYYGDVLAFKQFSLLNIVSAITLSIGNHNLSIKPDYLLASSLYIDYKKDRLSNNKSMPDFTQDYRDYDKTKLKVLSLDGHGYQQLPVALASCNPFGKYGEMLDIEGRTISPATFSNGTTAGFTLTCPLHLSIPSSLFSIGEGTPFFGIQQFSLSIALNTNYHDMFAIKPTVSGLNWDVIKQTTINDIRIDESKLRVKISAVPVHMKNTLFHEGTTVMKSHFKHFNEAVVQSGGIIDFSADQKTLVTTTRPIQLSAVPRKIYVWAERLSDKQVLTDGSEFVRRANVPKTYARIQRLTMSMDDQTAAGVSLSPSTLYDISVNNGLNLDFTKAQHLTGYPVCLSHNDFGLSKQALVGEARSMSLYFNLELANISCVESKYELKYAVVYDRVLKTSNGQTQVISALNNINPQVQSMESALVNFSSTSSQPIYLGGAEMYGGGDFYGGRKGGFVGGAWYHTVSDIISSLWKNRDAVKSGIDRGLDMYNAVKTAKDARVTGGRVIYTGEGRFR